MTHQEETRFALDQPHITAAVYGALMGDAQLEHAIHDFDNLRKDAPLTPRERQLLFTVAKLFDRERKAMQDRTQYALESIVRSASARLKFDAQTLVLTEAVTSDADKEQS